MQQTANDRVREIQQWAKIKAELDDGTFDTQSVNTHQKESLDYQLMHRRDCLTRASTQPEVLNVLGPLATLEKVMARGH